MRHLWISLFVAAVSMMFLLSRNSREMLKNYAGKYLIFAIFASAMLFYGATLFPRSATYEALENSLGIVQNRVVSVANTSGDESILWRSEIWKQATKQYLENPVLGIGFGKLIPVEIGKYHDFVEARNIHNSFLALLVQMGIFGIGLVTTLTAVLAVKVAKKKYSDKDVQIAAYSSLGILALQVVAFMFQPYLEANLLGIFFWINLGILRRLHE
jgi:O-antigen ligase